MMHEIFAGRRLIIDITILRTKCRFALHTNNCGLGIAGESSLDPHSFIYFIPADDELKIFIDRKIILRSLPVS